MVNRKKFAVEIERKERFGNVSKSEFEKVRKTSTSDQINEAGLLKKGVFLPGEDERFPTQIEQLW